MALHASLLVVLLVVAGLLGTVVSYGVWQYRPRAGATWLAVSTVGIIAFSLGEALLFATTSPGTVALALGVSAAGQLGSAAGWLLAGARYTGHDEWVRTPLVVVVWLSVGVLSVLVLLNPADLFFTRRALAAPGQPVLERGPAFLVYLAVGYSYQSGGLWLLFRKLRRSRNVYRRRTALLVLIGVVSLSTHVLGVLGLSPTPHLTLTPLSFLGLGVLSALVIYDQAYLHLLPVERVFGLVQSRFEDLGPIARDVVIEEMETGVLVLDAQNCIVDVNPAARRMLGVVDERIVGVPLERVVDEDAFEAETLPFLDPSVRNGHFDTVWVETPGGERMCYDIVVTDLGARREDVTGRVAIIHDVTETQRHRQRLEAQTRKLTRQNENLEDFANIVSHDLRNPLTVAVGHVEYAIDTGNVDQLPKARQAHDRMERIIDDVLDLARQGKSVSDTEPVVLDAVARDAWATVDPTDATLVSTFDPETTVEADRSRLRQAFENFFRNTLDHAVPAVASDRPDDGPSADGGDPLVTVRVGPLADGFYVEDDGPGIPPEERESVLKQGYTTSDGGTGLGLAIVATIVDAHGWEMTVSESDSGGARFEVTTE